MYFELVLVYPAAFINDISLMNFSASPHGLPFICCSAFQYVFPSLFGLVCLTDLALFQSCFICLSASADQLPVCWDCKGKNLFNVVKFFLKLFFLFSSVSLGFKKNNSSFLFSFSIPLLHLL